MRGALRCPLVLALALVAGSAANAGTPGAAAWVTRADADRALATFTATDLDGRRWTARDMHGRVVLLDFWATWCAPCLAELPRLKRLYAAYRRAGFEILGISLDAMSRRAFVSWLNRQRVDWPQIHERTGYGGRTARHFAIDRLPRTMLVARDGRIAAVDVRGEELETLVERLLAEGDRHHR